MLESEGPSDELDADVGEGETDLDDQDLEANGPFILE